MEIGACPQRIVDRMDFDPGQSGSHAAGAGLEPLKRPFMFAKANMDHGKTGCRDISVPASP